MGRGSERARFEIRLQRPRIGLSTVLLIFAGIGLFGALPHIDELRRCIEAKKKGLVGRDTPECLPEVFSSPS